MTALNHNVGQVVYPRMERQDLTQGQLGSFKFTPTDEVRPVFGISPRLAQRVQVSFGRDAPGGIGVVPRDNAPLLTDAMEHTTYSTRLDSTNFDIYSTANFDRPRQRMRSSTLETASDGPRLSPYRRHFQLEPNSPHQIPVSQYTDFRMSAQNKDQVEFATTQSPLLSFSPILSQRLPNDVDLIRISLARALTSEQEAHQLTKEALEIERSNRIKAQAEVERLTDHNRSLIGSVNMLKSVVQHNLKKEEEEEDSKSEVDRFYAEADAAPRIPTILHDAVERLKAPRESRDAESKMEDVLEEAVLAQSAAEELLAKEPSKKTAMAPALDDKDLFDFELVERLGTPALRRHFSNRIVTSDSEEKAEFQHSGDVANVQAEETAARREKSDATWESGETVIIEVPVEDDELNEQKSPSDELKGIPKTMVMPFDPRVEWKTCQIFDDDQDLLSRLKYDAPTFAQHPVRYIPCKSDKNLYRTVMMDFIPQGTTSKEILKTIRGGAVESIQLYGPIGTSTNFVTARVVFVYELAARTVYMRGQNPGIHIQGKKVRVWQVLEPTYPRNAELEVDIFDENFSRLLLIENTARAALAKLPQKLERQVRAGFIIEIGKAVDGIPMVEFTSIAASSNALRQLMYDRDFNGSRFDFETDPCAEPY